MRVVQFRAPQEGPPLGLLHQVAFLRGLPDADLEVLAGAAQPVEFSPGEYICRQGSPGNCLYVIEDGHVDLFLDHPTGARTARRTLGPGTFFGELAVIAEQPRDTSAVAQTPTRVWAIYRTTFRRFLFRHPQAVVLLLEHLATLIRDTHRRSLLPH